MQQDHFVLFLHQNISSSVCACLTSSCLCFCHAEFQLNRTAFLLSPVLRLTENMRRLSKYCTFSGQDVTITLYVRGILMNILKYIHNRNMKNVFVVINYDFCLKVSDSALLLVNTLYSSVERGAKPVTNFKRNLFALSSWHSVYTSTFAFIVARLDYLDVQSFLFLLSVEYLSVQVNVYLFT